MNVNTQKFQSQKSRRLNRKPQSTTVLHSLSHAHLGVPAPSEREPGMGCTIHPTTQKPQRCGRFSSPLRRLGRFWFLPFIERHSLSHALWACQLPQRGSREGVRTMQRTTRKPERCGRFSSPLRNSKVFTFHHTTSYSKTSGFHRKNDTGWARAPTYGNQLKA